MRFTLPNQSGVLFATLPDQWVRDPSSFLEATGSAVADVVLAEADRIIELIQDLVTLAAAAVKNLIDGASTIFTWLDRALDLGAMSGFYEGLTDNKLSLLDVACLSAAICLDGSPHNGVSRAAADSQAEARKARNAFLWVGVLTNTLYAFVSASCRAQRIPHLRRPSTLRQWQVL